MPSVDSRLLLAALGLAFLAGCQSGGPGRPSAAAVVISGGTINSTAAPGSDQANFEAYLSQGYCPPV